MFTQRLAVELSRLIWCDLFSGCVRTQTRVPCEESFRDRYDH